MEEKQSEKSPHALREERILKFWKEKGIFEKSLEKNKKSGKEFVFYEGPPTANGRPGIHHLEARAFKDVIPRYKTMRGFNVRRKGGWDTHGLPVELQVEKQLGFKSKKDIEAYGIAAFNEKCKESVWTYVHEWEDFTNRMGYWVDLKNPYITYKPEYIESVWNIMKRVEDQGLLYKDYKVVPWCPRCGTGLSSHELAQGYADVKDLAVTVKLKIKGENNTFILAWTTTPWTLPGNVGLAVGENIDYVQIKIGAESIILAKSRLSIIKDPYEIEKEFKGSELVGLEYEPLYLFLKENISGAEKEKMKNAYQIYVADFVTTEDGTGIVHTAVMYGQDDFELGTRVGLPKYHLVNEDGTFKKEAGFLAGKFVKDEATDVEIIKDLAGRGLLFHKEKYEHSYPFCWRCKTPLIYFARDSWYIRMSSLRKDLVKENEGIHWEPEHIKEGRFGEWLREVKDWAISRERYWGTPLPVWVCEKCGKRKVAGSIADVTKKPRNNYFIMRHGEAENNLTGTLNSDASKVFHLTPLGHEQVQKAAGRFKDKVDVIFTSPFLRAKETAEIFAETVGCGKDKIIVDARLHEMGMGELEGLNENEIGKLFGTRREFFTGHNKGVENRNDQKKRVGAFLEDIDTKYEGINILIVSHDSPLWMLSCAAQGLDIEQSMNFKPKGALFSKNAEIKSLKFIKVPHNSEYELDLHRPFIDAVQLDCVCGGVMNRVKEVMDVWFDSGAMPFAQDHYPFETKRGFFGIKRAQKLAYPADFISEAIDQTRGWFYTLHAIGALMGKGKAFKNVICLGHLLDAAGKKMSKSIGNVVDPWQAMDKYGADALRFWMYSINQPGESKNFDEKTVDDVIKKVFNLVTNTCNFYEMNASGEAWTKKESTNVLDLWIMSRMNQVVKSVTECLDQYVLLEPTRTIREFIADLSQWYVRRSRERLKSNGIDREWALLTPAEILLTLSKILAPFVPFFAEELYKKMAGPLESVHLEDWPVGGKVDKTLLDSMELVRKLCSLGLEARMSAKINVRQPLASLTIKDVDVHEKLTQPLIDLIKDEVNVKEVLIDSAIGSDVALDLNISAELKEEGDLRELLRKIQDLRKESGLSMKDRARLFITDELKGLVARHESEIKNATNLDTIGSGEVFAVKKM